MTTAIEQAAKALRLASSVIAGQPEYRHTQKAITAALARLADEQARLAPGMTDLMVPPETLGAWLDANPLPVSSPDRERLAQKLDKWAASGIVADSDRTAFAQAAAALRSPADGWRTTLTILRAAGWFVAVHNDYRLDGKRWTFWLLTHDDGRYVKGEGATDEEALAEAWAKASLPSPPAEEKAP